MATDRDLQAVQGTLITIGRVLRPFGPKGDLLVEPLTFNPDRFNELYKVALDNGSGLLWLSINDVKRHGKNLILSFVEIDNIEKARALTGSYIKIDKALSPPLPEGSYYHYQLEGLAVYDHKGDYLGKVQYIMQGGGADVYVVTNQEGEEHLIPAIRDVVLSVDLKGKKILVRLLEMV